MKRITALIFFAVTAVLLAACASPGLQPDSLSKTNASAACFSGPGWNGGKVDVLYVNADKGVSGTAGGNLTVMCGTTQAIFTDGGKLAPGGTRPSTTPATANAPASIDVPVRVNPVVQ